MEHIHANEVILTSGYSMTVHNFLKAVRRRPNLVAESFLKDLQRFKCMHVCMQHASGYTFGSAWLCEWLKHMMCVSGQEVPFL
jgi:hypothetical protein